MQKWNTDLSLNVWIAGIKRVFNLYKCQIVGHLHAHTTHDCVCNLQVSSAQNTLNTNTITTTNNNTQDNIYSHIIYGAKPSLWVLWAKIGRGQVAAIS